MQELEKIFKEIDTYSLEFVMFGGKSDAYISSKWVKDIIRKYINDGWIPVDKNNVPDHEILACDRYGNELIGYLSYNADSEEFVCESDECVMHQVIAWMEKPEPYHPESETEKPDWRQDMLRKFDRRE